MSKDITQEMMNEVYDFWQLEENGGKRKNEILECFSSAHQIAVHFGNFNKQVENGGISQWISNGYMEDDLEELLEFATQGKLWGIVGIEKFYELFATIEKLMGEWEEHSMVTCPTCAGTGEIDKDELDEDEDEDEVTVTCDECYGSGDWEEANDYPYEFSALESEYYKWEEVEKFATIDALIIKQLEEQEEERVIETFLLKRGTKTVVAVQENPHTDSLHLLDTDEEGTTSLTNAIEAVESLIKERYSFDKLYLYHTDGMVTEYKDGTFVHVNEKDAFIYRPFYLRIQDKKALN